MTDPVTNLEIEDVLSSIRRLVSENARGERPAEQGEGPVAEDGASAAAGDKAGDAPEAAPRQEAQLLVLTPALRVGDDDGDSAGDAAQETAGQAAHEALDDAVGEAVDKAALELAIEDAVHDAVEAAVSEAVADDTPEPEPADAVPAFSHSPNNGDSGQISTLADRIAGLEAAVAEREDNWDPDGLNDDDNAGAPVDALSWEDSDLPLKGWENDAPLAVEEAEVLGDDAAEPAIDLAAFATAAAGGEAPAERDAPSLQDELNAALADDALASSGADGQADRQADWKADRQADGQDSDTGSAAEFFGAEDTVVDEEMLRDMVSEIVRRELQGSLGERITRNVRKLVRREIHRALAARELD